MKHCSIWALLSAATVFAAVSPEAAEEARRDGRLEEARSIYNQLLEAEPGNLEYAIWVARISGWLGQYAAAEEAFDAILAERPDNVEALTGLASIQLWQGDFARAAALLEKSRSIAPADLDTLLASARLERAGGRYKPAMAYIRRALELDPDHSEAHQLQREIVRPQRSDLLIGYGRDDFSFRSPGNVGFLSGRFRARRLTATLDYEEWDRFDSRAHRGGVHLDGQVLDGLYLRGGAKFAPGAEVIARQEYDVGVSRRLPRGWSSGLDYRHLEFSDARVDFLIPSLEYYFERPAWIRVAYSQSWTRFEDSPEPVGNESFTGNYYHRVANPLLLRLGYAYGNESFTGLSVDRIGNFSAHTYIGGLEIEISRNAEIGMAYAYQDRQDGGFQHSVRLHLRLRR